MSQKKFKVESDINSYLFEVAERISARLPVLMDFLERADTLILQTPQPGQTMSITTLQSMRQNYLDTNKMLMDALEFVRKVATKPPSLEEGSMTIQDIAHKLALLKPDDLIMLQALLRKTKDATSISPEMVIGSA